MNVLYICRVSEHQAQNNQIDIPRNIGIDFFNIPKDNIINGINTEINICHKNDLQDFHQIEIQPATNLRWSTKLNKLLSDHGDSLSDGDLLIFEKINKSFCVHSIKQDDSKYTTLIELMDNGDKHMLLSCTLNNMFIEPLLSTSSYLSYLTALRTKPFMLLAGISGTGKSRIVRELAKACWKQDDEEFGKNHPKNFCMVQVKPNWHDSSELIGYVSRINGEKFVVGPFLRFLAKASKDPNTPYFLCLDEMNLAPVEQYFAEYLSVIESRKLNEDGSITTDPIIPFENTEAYGSLIDQLFDDEVERKAYKTENNGNRLTIPQNLFVVGTVNMDETTFSFSRKVLDRAMTIEMNEVDLHGGLTDEGTEIGYIGNSIIGSAAEGKDVYSSNKELCDNILSYLEDVNRILEGTPFKIAYRTRNEFLLYAVNRKLLDKDSQPWQTLDEMTSMKILSRIEGDSERTQNVLNKLKDLVDNEIVAQIPNSEEGKENLKSVSASKIEEMLGKLKVSGYTSYWT